MSARKFAVLVLATLVACPFLASAQSTGICSVTRTLARRSTGDDVTILQTFLADQGYFNQASTGYFGLRTEAALANWQFDVSIIASIANGGVYGRRSRAYVQQHFCGAQAQTTSTPPPSQTQQVYLCPPPPSLPTNLSCSAEWQKIYDTNSCHVGWSCIVYVSSQNTASGQHQPPIITAIQGPTTRKADERGTWTITAANYTTSPLGYSVIWGDEGVNVSQLLDLAGQGTNYSSSNSFSHTYKISGAYTMIAFVKDMYENTTKATFSLQVQSPPPAPAPPLPPPMPPPSPPSSTSGNTSSSGSCVIHRHCGDITIPNGDIAYYACCAVGSFQRCVDGALVRASYYDATGGHTITTNCPGDPISVSDIRQKRDVVPMGDSLDKLLQLNAIFFKYRDSTLPQGEQMGLIAQEVQNVFPDAVITDANGTLYVNYAALIAPIVEALKELQAKNDVFRALSTIN